MIVFFFSPLGRLQQYVFTLGWMFWLLLELGCWSGFLAAAYGTTAHSAWYFAAITVSGLSTVSVVLLGMKRLRDAGLPVWPALILLAPFISLIALVAMSNLPSRNDKPAG